MVGELIKLPLRLTQSVARVWGRATDQAMSLGWSAAGYVIGRVTPVGADSRPAGPRTSAGEASVVRSAQASSAVAAAPRLPEQESRPLPTRAPEPPPASPVEEPAHVSEEPALVEEFAEPGAEDGAGAELHIREPWEGYRDMSARDVTARLSDASDAELAAIQLYESTNRNRQTILSAVSRQLRGMQHRLPGANGRGHQR